MNLNTEVFVTAIFVFGVAKTFFYLLGWLFPEADKTYRKHLDSFFEFLDDYSIFELGHLILIRFVQIVEKLFRRPIRGYLAFGAISFVLNDLVFIITTNNIVLSSESIFDEWGIEDLQGIIEELGWIVFWSMMLLVGFLGTIFDLISLAVTLTLLRWASQAKSPLLLLVHLVIDILVATISCLWAYVILDFTIRLYKKQILSIVEDRSDNPGGYIGDTLWTTLDGVENLWYVVIWLGVSVALPTILYLVVLLPVLILRVLTPALQKALSRVVFLLTTDNKPVLFQLATFFSYFGALLAATLTWLNNMSS